MSKSGLTGCLIFLFGMTVCHAAWAQSCTVTASSSGFGSYDPLSSADVDSTGQVQVECTLGLSYNVLLDAGQNSGGSFSPRKLKHASLSWYLNYNLYVDAGRSAVWGDGTGGTSYVSDTGQGVGNPVSYTVYGRIPGLQNVYTGSYSDLITVTVRY